MHPDIHCSILYTSQAVEATLVPINKQVDEKAVVHLHNGILFSSKKKKAMLPFATAWMDGPEKHYAE